MTNCCLCLVLFYFPLNKDIYYFIVVDRNLSNCKLKFIFIFEILRFLNEKSCGSACHVIFALNCHERKFLCCCSVSSFASKSQCASVRSHSSLTYVQISLYICPLRLYPFRVSSFIVVHLLQCILTCSSQVENANETKIS